MAEEKEHRKMRTQNRRILKQNNKSSRERCGVIEVERNHHPWKILNSLSRSGKEDEDLCHAAYTWITRC